MVNFFKKTFGLLVTKINSILDIPLFQKILFIVYLTLLPFLCLTRDVFHLYINKYVFIAICLLFSILLNKKNFLYLFVYTIPFLIGLPDLYIYAIFVIIILIRFFKNFSIKKWLLIISVPIFFCVLEIVLTYIYGNLNLKDSFRLFSVLFFLSFCFYNRNLLNYKHILMLFFGYVIAYVLITLQVVEVGFWGIKHRLYDWVNFKNMLRVYRFGTKENAASWVNTGCKIQYPYLSSMYIQENPNKIGLNALICGSTAYFVYPIISDKKDKRLCIILGILITLFGFWSISRSFILFEISMGIVILLFSVIHKRSKLIDTLIILSSVILGASLFLLLNKNFLQSVLGRFFDNDVVTGGGRITLIGEYFSKMFSSFKYVFFGVGATNITHEYGINVPPHTNFVQLFCGYGLPITLLFIAFVIYCFIKFQKRIKVVNYQFGFYIPMIFGFLFTLTSQIFFPTVILVIFIPTAILASFNNKNTGVVVPENVHYVDTFDNISSSNCFSIGSVSFIDNTHKIKNIDPKRLHTRNQIAKFEKDYIKIKPAYIIVDFNDLLTYKKMSSLLRKVRSCPIFVVCNRTKNVSFKEKLMKFFIWDSFNFIYRSKVVAKKFEGRKFVEKHGEIIFGVSHPSIDRILDSLNKTKKS